MNRPPDDPTDDEVTGEIIGIAIDIHRELGPTLEEQNYHRALSSTLDSEGFDVVSEYEFELHYNGKPAGTARADLMIDGEVIVELKAVRRTTWGHFNQLKRTIGETPATRGLLLNFGEPTLGITRVVDSTCDG